MNSLIMLWDSLSIAEQLILCSCVLPSLLLWWGERPILKAIREEAEARRRFASPAGIAERNYLQALLGEGSSH